MNAPYYLFDFTLNEQIPGYKFYDLLMACTDALIESKYRPGHTILILATVAQYENGERTIPTTA